MVQLLFIVDFSSLLILVVPGGFNVPGFRCRNISSHRLCVRCFKLDSLVRKQLGDFVSVFPFLPLRQVSRDRTGNFGMEL